MNIKLLYFIRLCNIEDNFMYNLKLVVFLAEDAISCTVVQSVNMAAAKKVIFLKPTAGFGRIWLKFCMSSVHRS